ncbi:hypothetical protein [Rhizobium grahamii]|uniref:hypothetical protein n=1 Tax=Rhizobium grahamii TaxID=1120045 RepID=UPI00167686F2|nr:hypothetical protein [Rhizobium grahamii]
MDFPKDTKPSIVKKQTDDGWSIVTYNCNGVLVQERFFTREPDANQYFLQQQAMGKR